MKPAAGIGRIHQETVETQGNAPSDEALMQRFCEGQTDALDALYGRYAVPLHGYLVRMTGVPAVAQELVQETFLSVVRARTRYLRGAPVKPWLYAIATNAARDAGRRRSHAEAYVEQAKGAPETVAAEERDVGLERCIQAALAQLPDAQREAIVLHRFEGLSFAEIGEALNVPESTVKVRAHRGYERLRALLQEVWEEWS